MNLFLVGDRGDAGQAAAVLESLRAPFLEDAVLSPLPGGACLAHPPERVGGVRYSVVDGSRFALFAGRPIRWAGGDADGRGPLDPAAYLDGGPDGLDGRFAVVRGGPDGLEVQTDPLGAYPVYRWGNWASNSPEALRRLRAADEGLDLDCLAGVVGGGWSLTGGPLWAGIERVTWSGARITAPGEGFSARRAAGLLVAGLRALADWPGRPSVVLVTGGRDSRLILAAALRAGFAFDARTGGLPDAPDVVSARKLCGAAGVEHGLLDPHPHGDFRDHWPAMARVLAQTTGGTATLADAAGFPLLPLDGPLPLWHTGQGGEIARGYYGAPDLDGLVQRFLGERPGRRSPLSAAGRERVRAQIEAWAAELAAPAEDLGDLFYLHQRMARWAAPTHAAVEPIRDSTSALWSWALLPDLLGLPAADRRRGAFHAAVLAELAPELAGVPYAEPAHRSLPSKVLAELRRRTRRTHRVEASAALRGSTLHSMPMAPGHPAWEVLDRARAEQLLATPLEGLDEMSRQYVWRLATVFGGFLPDGPLAQ